MAGVVQTELVAPQLLVTLDNLLTHDECRALIHRADQRGWSTSPPGGGGNGRTGREDARTNDFAVLSDPELARLLWTRVAAFVPSDLSHIPFNTYLNSSTRGTEWTPVGVVDKMRFYKYPVGTAFPEHVDYKSGRDIVRQVDGKFEVRALPLCMPRLEATANLPSIVQCCWCCCLRTSDSANKPSRHCWCT
jgi:hypothetical protein